jgi:ubiquitin C-terminal hydrolase
VKAEEARREIVVIDEKLKKLEEEGSSETYVLWAVMIHEGTSAVHGHYKVCISINDNWFEYNDRIVRAIPAARIEEFKNKGEICCLFYRRPSLLCDSQRIPVPLSLKTLVGQQ